MGGLPKKKQFWGMGNDPCLHIFLPSPHAYLYIYFFFYCVVYVTLKVQRLILYRWQKENDYHWNFTVIFVIFIWHVISLLNFIVKTRPEMWFCLVHSFKKINYSFFFIWSHSVLNFSLQFISFSCKMHNISLRKGWREGKECSFQEGNVSYSKAFFTMMDDFVFFHDSDFF